METLRSIVVFLALTNLAAAQTPQAEAPVTPRAQLNIEFIGNSYYDAASLRTGLMLDRDTNRNRRSSECGDQR